MTSVVKSVCDCCGETAEPKKVPVATDGGIQGVQNTDYHPRIFQCADGSTRKLPEGWWIFELTSYNDEHIVAECCASCAEIIGKYVKRKSKKAAELVRAALEAPLAPSLPKLLPAKKKGKKSLPAAET